jgi:phosphoserine phosphatase
MAVMKAASDASEWRRDRPRSVVFDCDSTLVGIEGINWLATDHRDEIAALTDAAMSGEIPLEEIYGRRLDIVRPALDHVLALADAYENTLIPDARDVVRALHDAGIAVYVISGGLELAVQRLASSIGIATERVRAVAVEFDVRGCYTGYDESSPLARSGGKREVVEQWQPPLARPVWLIGDGTTDLEAKPAVDVFIAFTGVVEHREVRAHADFVITERSLAPVVALCMGEDEPTRSPGRELYRRGRQLLGFTE